MIDFLKRLLNFKDPRDYANSESRYRNFSGEISWGDNFGFVENAYFDLMTIDSNTMKNRRYKIIIWHDGTWVKGCWHMGKWESGIWLSGWWHNGVWKKGEWHGGFNKLGVYYKYSPAKWGNKEKETNYNEQSKAN